MTYESGWCANCVSAAGIAALAAIESMYSFHAARASGWPNPGPEEIRARRRPAQDA
jgi:hypothetical protein